jgi:hypothetical protein
MADTYGAIIRAIFKPVEQSVGPARVARKEKEKEEMKAKK